MKALIKTQAAPGLTMGEVDKPEPGPNEVLIRIARAAICGTDLHIFNWDAWAQENVPVPLVTGHEYAGVIESVGDRVSGEGHLVCGYCRNCRAGREHLCRNTKGVGVNRPGAFADYLVIPAPQRVSTPRRYSR